MLRPAAGGSFPIAGFFGDDVPPVPWREPVRRPESAAEVGGVAEPPAPRDPDADRYTYVFEGNSQVLDNILLSAPLIRGGYGYDVVHVNAEFADQVSDHDPQVVRLVVR